MPSSFKNSIRGLLASVRGSVMDAPGASLNDAVQKILSHQHALGWTNSAFSIIVQSNYGPALLNALQNDIRVHKAAHYKKRTRMLFKGIVEHEFVVVHLRFGTKEILLRVDRSIGPRKYKQTEKSTEVSGSSNTGSPVSPPGSSSPAPSSGSASSIGSILVFPALLVNYCVCRLSKIANISSPDRWARDTIVTIEKVPSDSYEVTTIEYAGSSSKWPSLWDLIHLVEFVHEQDENYDTFDAQCYWFADTISALLAGWCDNARVTLNHGWKGIRSKDLSVPAPGTLKGLPIYRRDKVIIQTQKAGLAEYVRQSTQRTLEHLDSLKGGDLKGRRMKAEAEERAREAEERAEARAREAEERAEARAREAERAEARVNEIEAQLKIEHEARLRSEMRLQVSETRVHELSTELKKVDARASHSDALTASIMTGLDDQQSWHGPSVIV